MSTYEAMPVAPLSGKVAIVTGGAIGIGAGIVLALARAGADVAFTHLRHDPSPVLDEVTGLGRRGTAVRLDATDSAAVTGFTEQVVREFGRLDIVVNNAGGMVGRRPLAEITDEHWHQVMDVNLSSTFYVARAAAPHLGAGGRIVNISSVAGHNGGGTGATAYATSKAAVHGLTRALARELAPRGITVNAVAPGFIADTPFHAEHTSPAAQLASVHQTPVGRAGRPQDVADAVLYLASEGAGFVTGEILDLNGGSYFA